MIKILVAQDTNTEAHLRKKEQQVAIQKWSNFNSKLSVLRRWCERFLELLCWAKKIVVVKVRSQACEWVYSVCVCVWMRIWDCSWAVNHNIVFMS